MKRRSHARVAGRPFVVVAARSPVDTGTQFEEQLLECKEGRVEEEHSSSGPAFVPPIAVFVRRPLNRVGLPRTRCLPVPDRGPFMRRPGLFRVKAKLSASSAFSARLRWTAYRSSDLHRGGETNAERARKRTTLPNASMGHFRGRGLRPAHAELQAFDEARNETRARDPSYHEGVRGRSSTQNP